MTNGLQRLLLAGAALASRHARPTRLFGRGSVVRNALAATIATAVDLAVVLAALRVTLVAPPVATLLGCAVGAAFNFTANRVWTFGSGGHPAVEVGRYALVSAGSAMLNSGLVALALALGAVSTLGAWWVVRGLVFVTWNYPLQRDYVFATLRPAALEAVEANSDSAGAVVAGDLSE